MARPTNEERYSPQAQKDKLREIVGEALVQLKTRIKKADVRTLSDFVMKMYPYIIDDDTQTSTDMTLELLAKRALKVQLRIQDATEAQLKPEEIKEEEDDNS